MTVAMHGYTDENDCKLMRGEVMEGATAAEAAGYLITRVEVHRLPEEAETQPGVAGVDGNHEQNPAYAALLPGVAEVGAVLHDEVGGQAAGAECAPEHGEPYPLVRPGSTIKWGWGLAFMQDCYRQ
jgi:hypothetical protein